ncbi:MAG: EF-P lysine aminoacylase GenX [Alphaproteobacteria bacterium]|nr:EF-P lysine aminoacylase GenX [Alphaproteobacteria bacterium]
MWWSPETFEKKKTYLEKRMLIVRAMRRFFDERGFWAVETPALQECPAVDRHLHAFKTERKGADLTPLETLYLHTSPELAMKQLMVAGVEKPYQICHVYRNGEGSRIHACEFTMVEWYRRGEDYRALMEDCEALLKAMAQEIGAAHFEHRGVECDPFAPWVHLSVREAFERYAGLELDDLLEDRDALAAAARGIGVRVIESDGWDDIFHAVMAEKIEPHLGQGTVCILYDYPACLASLARLKPEDTRYCERFELYVCAVELANGFSELTDAQQQSARFETEMQAREKLYGAGEAYPQNKSFEAAMAYGYPASAGIALGVDRLVMLACGAEKLDDVLWCGM